jgi:VWFA-related protein
MKVTIKPILVGFLAAGLLASLCGLPARAQAPDGPQNGGQPQAPATPAQQQTQQPQQKAPEAGVTISVEVPVVNLDVIVATQNGDIIPGLKKENFRVIEDGVPQTIGNFAPTDAPITMVVLLEFDSIAGGWFAYQAKYWTGALFPNLKPKDWVSLVTFDMRPRLEVDFTQNKDEVQEAIRRLYFPGFSESNLFDALLDTTERLKDVKGKKSILIMATGLDTFSKNTLDKTLKQLRQTDTTIFAVGVDRPLNNMREARGSLGSIAHMNYLQGENQLKTFAQMTGGFAWFPQFEGELPGIFQEVAAFLRNQYSISYTPTNRSQDGKFRKIKVEIVAADGSPLIVNNQKGKKQKLVVYHREGYQSIKGGVGD